ncbi:cupin domain-containing protein [Methyloversatilis sp.]|uniref:cupin domain-containing protein n=1 Tax=Methyloversatilis sp. TaxID=2569862 RepID=UPI0035AE878F
MYPIQFHADELAWQDSGIAGVRFKILDGNPAERASVVLYRFEPGSVVAQHLHTGADELAYVLEGAFIEDERIYGAGAVFAAPAGSGHGPHRTDSGCTVMFVLSAALDFVALPCATTGSDTQATMTGG